LLVATEPLTYDRPDGTPAVLHEGCVVRSDHPLVKGRESLFMPLVIVLYGDREQLPIDATVTVTGESGAGYRQYIRMAVATDTPPHLRD
jgi:hypothetical protein